MPVTPNAHNDINLRQSLDDSRLNKQFDMGDSVLRNSHGKKFMNSRL